MKRRPPALMAGQKGRPLSDETARDQRRLVLGAAVGFRVDQVRVFVESLRATGYAGDVTMLVGPLQWRLRSWLARHKVRTLSHWSTRKLHGPIHAYRFERFAKILRAAAGRYDQVLVSDVRDVLFQQHPFMGVTSPGCHFYLEAGPWTIGTEPTNWRWAKIFLTAAEAERIGPCRITCCGVLLGGAVAMTDYLTRLAGYLHALPIGIRPEGGADTVFHNKIAHLTHEVVAEIVENDVHVATMGLTPPAAYVAGEDGLIRTADGRLPAILHQYDRLPDIARVVAAKYRLPG
jgi:hypothetical protein